MPDQQNTRIRPLRPERPRPSPFHNDSPQLQPSPRVPRAAPPGVRQRLIRPPHPVRTLRILSLPILYRGHRLSISISLCFLLVVATGLGWHFATGSLRYICGALALFSLLRFAFWFSAHLQRELGLRRLARLPCACCQTIVGRPTASVAFAAYTHSFLELIHQSRGSPFTDLGSPLYCGCRACGRGLFFDYLNSGDLPLFDSQQKSTSVTP